jgi:hypothetical protein
MESKKINQLATELSPDLSDLTIIGDPTTGISKKITLSQMASLFTGTVEEYANLAAFPLVGVADTIYIALDTNILYRWNTGTSAYVELSPNIVSSLVFNDANGFDGTINLVGSVATLTITTALTTGSVGFIGASGALLQDNANFFWDDTNNRLGLGTNAPTTALDVFGSGIIGRINGTSTNNAYLGFASAGTNKWSVGNVQSDHRFRIFSEANSAELVSVLQTGEFGIGIANPTTKFHIDGAASALIANLDANVSIAKSISFRSDNSARINIEVSGTESGSNVGADLFIKTFSDAGSLLATPITITRSTGLITLSTALSATSGVFSSTLNASAFIPSGATIPTNGMYLSAANTLNFATNTTNRLFITSTGIVVIGGSAASRKLQVNTSGNDGIRIQTSGDNPTLDLMQTAAANAGARNWRIVTNWEGWGTFDIQSGTTNTEDPATTRVSISGTTGNVGIGIGNASSILYINAQSDSVGGNGIRLGNSAVSRIWNTRFGTNTDLSYNLDFYDGSSWSNRIKFSYLGASTFNCGAAADTISLNNSNANPYGINNSFTGAAPNNTSNYFLNCSDTTNTKLIIYSNGNIVNRNNSYGGISDIKLKENIVDATPKLENLLKVRIINYNLIGDEQKQIGVVAQELEQIFPSIIDESEDFEDIEIINEEGNITKEKKSLGTTTKSVKYSVFIPMLIKAIQEQQAQIEELKALINK